MMKCKSCSDSISTGLWNKSSSSGTRTPLRLCLCRINFTVLVAGNFFFQPRNIYSVPKLPAIISRTTNTNPSRDRWTCLRHFRNPLLDPRSHEASTPWTADHNYSFKFLAPQAYSPIRPASYRRLPNLAIPSPTIAVHPSQSAYQA
jgi:hypothetical protein